MSGLESNPDYEVIAGSFDDANERNIPVGVTIIDTEEGTFELRADNYMPFKDQVDQEYYGISAASTEPLRQIVAEKVIPLYELALGSLQSIVNGTSKQQLWFETGPPAEDNQSQE